TRLQRHWRAQPCPAIETRTATLMMMQIMLSAYRRLGKNSGQTLRLNRMNIRKIAAVVVMAVIGTWSADAASPNDGRSPAGPQFTNFKDGDTVSNPVIVRFTSAGATMRHNMGH